MHPAHKGKNANNCFISRINETFRVCTDLEKSLNLTLVLENLEFEKSIFCPGIVLEFCKIILENMN